MSEGEHVFRVGAAYVSRSGEILRIVAGGVDTTGYAPGAMVAEDPFGDIRLLDPEGAEGWTEVAASVWLAEWNIDPKTGVQHRRDAWLALYPDGYPHDPAPPEWWDGARAAMARRVALGSGRPWPGSDLPYPDRIPERDGAPGARGVRGMNTTDPTGTLWERPDPLATDGTVPTFLRPAPDDLAALRAEVAAIRADVDTLGANTGIPLAADAGKPLTIEPGSFLHRFAVQARQVRELQEQLRGLEMGQDTLAGLVKVGAASVRAARALGVKEFRELIEARRPSPDQ